jgi:hypothetical protein
MKLLAYLLMPAALLSGIRMATITNDELYFYLGLGISVGCAVVVYKLRGNAKPISRQP